MSASAAGAAAAGAAAAVGEGETSMNSESQWRRRSAAYRGAVQGAGRVQYCCATHSPRRHRQGRTPHATGHACATHCCLSHLAARRALLPRTESERQIYNCLDETSSKVGGDAEGCWVRLCAQPATSEAITSQRTTSTTPTPTPTITPPPAHPHRHTTARRQTAAELSEELGKSERELVEIINGMLNKVRGGALALPAPGYHLQEKPLTPPAFAAICVVVSRSAGSHPAERNSGRQPGIQASPRGPEMVCSPNPPPPRAALPCPLTLVSTHPPAHPHAHRKIGLDQNDRCICDKIEAAGGKGQGAASA